MGQSETKTTQYTDNTTILVRYVKSVSHFQVPVSRVIPSLDDSTLCGYIGQHSNNNKRKKHFSTKPVGGWQKTFSTSERLSKDTYAGAV